MFSVIILAAGAGSRFKSAKSKILHEIGGLPIINHLIRKFNSKFFDAVYLVVDKLNQNTTVDGVNVCFQKEKLGTADAVLAVDLEKISSKYVFVLYGDTPFISELTITNCMELVQNENLDCLVISSDPNVDNEYGRLLLDKSGNVVSILEKGCFNENNDEVSRFCNNGFLIKTQLLKLNIKKIKKNTIKNEFLLTDIVSILHQANYKNGFIVVDKSETIGINDRFDLIEAEKVFQKNFRNNIINNGVTLIDPDTVYFSFDTVIEEDVVIYPNVYFMPNVRVKSGSVIYSNSVLEGCVIHNCAKIGPFARIRPQSEIMNNVKIGNFVEIKNSVVNINSKIQHLSYIGDAVVGESTNIGAGTITCNFDGFKKQKTNIGDNVFVGANVSLIAPVAIADDVLIGAGSVVTKNAEVGELVIGRVEQINIKKGVSRYRKNKCVE